MKIQSQFWHITRFFFGLKLNKIHAWNVVYYQRLRWDDGSEYILRYPRTSGFITVCSILVNHNLLLYWTLQGMEIYHGIFHVWIKTKIKIWNKMCITIYYDQPITVFSIQVAGSHDPYEQRTLAVAEIMMPKLKWKIVISLCSVQTCYLKIM